VRWQRAPTGLQGDEAHHAIQFEHLSDVGNDMTTLERLHELVDRLPESERETAARMLEALGHSPQGAALFASQEWFWGRRKSIEELAAEQGVKPIQDIDQLAGDFWPEDEGPDDFVNTLRRWRREDSEA
jgi:hypothetical protein